jgi:ABC-type Na+ efflux pump permease subunit
VQLSKLLRIARWEVTKNAGGVDRRTIVIAVGAIALFGLISPIVVGGGGPGLDDGLYRVGVDEDSQYHQVATADAVGDPFVVVSDADRDDLGESIDLLVDGGRVIHADTQKGQAAQQEFRQSVQSYNNRQLSLEDNTSAAFPVSVTLQYRQQNTGLAAQAGGDDDTGDGGPGGDGAGDGDSGGDGAGDGDSGGDGAGDGADGPGGDGSDGDGDDGTVDPGESGDLGGLTGSLSGNSIEGSPADINPPFPFQSLVLAFLFIIPLNFLIQAYGSTILSERINRRGELLLVSPVSRYDIIAGKTLPYFLGAMAAESAIAVGVFYLIQGGVGGFVSILAVVPLVLLFLGSTFLGAMFARSFKELTFVTVTITVSLTSYAFVPAIFTDVDEIALISPLTLVVRDLQNEAVSLGGFVFSTTPPLLAALVFFGLGAGLYREEDMFAQRSIPGRVLDALVSPIPDVTGTWSVRAGVRRVVPGLVRRPASFVGRILPTEAARLDQYIAVGGLTALLIPFVFVAQLLAIALLFALGEISVILVLVVVVITEEIAKSLHIYAGYAHSRFSGSVRGAVGLGVASGVGFFLAEKIGLLAQLVGLQQIPTAQAGLAGSITPQQGALVLLFLFAPLALHVVTATISAAGARRSKGAYAVALGVAMVVHLVYNLTVVVALVQ